MSRDDNMYTRLVKVKAGNRKSLLDALAELGDCDCDFIGENGLEYLWEEVWEENGFQSYKDFETQSDELDSDDDDFEETAEIELKYESNLDYLLDQVKDIEDDKECVETFIETWMDNDRNYYDQYEVNYLTDTKNRITAISFAVLAGY